MAPKERKLKSELDATFLALIDELKSQQGIAKDAAMSRHLGLRDELINRVRTGKQSATPEAWDILFKKYPESRNITTNNVMSQGGGQAIGTNHGTMNYGQDVEHFKPKRQADTPYYEWGNSLFVPAEIHDALKREAELLKGQLADKERIIQLLEKSK